MELSSLTSKAKSALRPYQADVLARMVRERRHLNYMDMGMGKSLVTLTAVMELQAFPCLIVCSKSAMGVMEEELRKWFGMEAIIYGGKPKQREEQWKRFVVGGFKFIITNYSMAGEIGMRFGIVPETLAKGSRASGTNKTITPTPGTKLKIGALVADEIQLGGLFNEKTKTYKIFKKLAREIPNVFLLTGTPYRKGCIDFYGPLSLVAPETFKSYWSFVGNWCRTIDDGFGKSIERIPRDVVGFRNMLRKYATIMKKQDYLHELPGKQRVPVLLDMEPEQARVYKELTEDLFAETDTGELIMTPGVLSLSVRQRQLLVAPQVLGLKGRGAALEATLEMTEDLVEGGKPFVIFTPFKGAVPYIADALRGKYGAIKIFQITGGLTPQEFATQWKGFQEYTGRGSSALICVIKSGASFHATRADTCFFLGYEWDFNQNAQAEDRLNRMGQPNAVTCYYMMHKGTVDEDVTRKLNEKQYSGDLILAPDDVFQLMINRNKKRQP